MTQDPPAATGPTDDRLTLTPTVQRLIATRDAIHAEPPGTIDYLHTVFCQIALPYRDPDRLARDDERLPTTLAGLHVLAFVCLMVQRAAPLLASGP